MYTPIEGGFPPNLLDELRNISAAFARLRAEFKAEVARVREELPGEPEPIEFPEFPSVEDSEAYKDLLRETRDLRALSTQLDEKYQLLVEEANRKIRELLDGILSEEQIKQLIGEASVRSTLFLTNTTERVQEKITTEIIKVENKITQIESLLVDFSMSTEFDPALDYSVGALVTYLGGMYVALQNMTAPSPLPTDPTYWEYIGAYATLGDALLAYSVRLSTLDSRVEDIDGVLVAVGTSITQLESAVSDVELGLSSKASISYVDQTKADIYGSEATLFTGLTATFTALQDGIDTKASVEQLNNAIADVYGAEVTAFTKISAEFDSVDLALEAKASLTELGTAIAGVYGAEVSAFTLIDARFNTVDQSLDAKASITQLNEAKAEIYGASTSSFTSIDASFSAVYAEIAELSLTPEFDPTASYEPGDMVTYTGKLYRALQAMSDPSPFPTDEDYWQLIGDFSSLGEAVAKLASDVAALESDIETRATFSYVDQTKADIFGASSAQFTGLTLAFAAIDTSLASKVETETFNTAIANVYGAQLSSFTNISLAFDGLQQDVNSRITQTQLNTAIANVYGAQTSAFTNIQLSFDSVDLSLSSKVEVETFNTAVANIYGAELTEFTKISLSFSNLQNDVNSRITETQLNTAIAGVYGAELSSFSELSLVFSDLQNDVNSRVTETQLNTAIAGVYGAELSSFTNIELEFSTVYQGINSKVGMLEVSTAIADAQGASVESFSQINARFVSTDQAIDNKASLTYVNELVADETGALASTLSLLGAESLEGDAFILNQSTVQVTPGTSWASWETTLEASINSKATITQWQEVKDSTDDLYAKAGIQLNVNDYIIGWSLNNDGDSGEMVILADKFKIVNPLNEGLGQTPVIPFQVEGNNVYINNAFIKELTADKITAGEINVPLTLSGSIVVPAGGYLRSGQTGYNTGTGWWLGHVSGNPRFSIGNSEGNRLTWDGTSLHIVGSITLTAPIPNSDVSGLGTLATANSANWQTQVTGTGKPADNADVTLSAVNGGLTLTGGGLNLSSGTSAIRSGQTGYNIGNGWWLGRDSNGARFSIGNGESNYMRWTGTSLQTSKLVVSDSEIFNSPLSPNAARIHTGGGRTAPFVIYDITDHTLLNLWNPGYSTGHWAKRVAFANVDVLISAAMTFTHSGGEFPESGAYYLQRRINGGSWQQVALIGTITANSSGTYRGTFIYRYTTPNTWNILDLRIGGPSNAVLPGNSSAQVTIFINNANQAPAASSDTGGTAPTQPLDPGDWTPPPGSHIP
jgi:hypothetical protein